MTAYWDALRHEVQEASLLSNVAFVGAVMAIETRVIRTVSLTTGDREFPDDLREKIQGLIAVHALRFDGNPRAKEWLLVMRYSRLLEDLHAAFHQVAAYRAPNRYDSRFTDDPTSFLAAREAALGEVGPQ